MTIPTESRVRPVGVEELRRAWLAVQDGQFRTRPGQRILTPARHYDPAARGAPTWTPTEQTVLPIIGCLGQAGTSTTALAIAAAAGRARVVECCTAAASGFTGAATAELGITGTGWALGRRDEVTIARTTQLLTGPGEVPRPDDPEPGVTLTVLDIGWELGQVLAAPGWVNHQIRRAGHVVAVTTATIPGLRRLETALTLLEHTRVVVAVLGPARRRWPRGVEHSLGPLTRALDRGEDIVQVPRDAVLAVRGVDSTPLPGPLLKAAAQILRRAEARPTQRGLTR